MPKKTTEMPLKQRVRIYLATKGLTQSRLADELGIAESHLSEVLSRKQSASLQLATALEDLTGIPAREFTASSDTVSAS